MKHTHAIGLFILAVILAGGVFWWLWTTQVNFGRSVEGTRALAELQMEREALKAHRPAGDMMSVTARNGCCVFLQRPSDHHLGGGKIMVDIVPSGANCYEDEIVQGRVKVGYMVVDIEPQPCPKKLAV